MAFSSHFEMVAVKMAQSRDHVWLCSGVVEAVRDFFLCSGQRRKVGPVESRALGPSQANGGDAQEPTTSLSSAELDDPATCVARSCTPQRRS